MQDRFNFKFWDNQEKVILDWDCICQTAWNCTREEGNKMQRYGLMYWCFTTPERFTPLQCTGLKDKNGKLIYEGDIVYNSIVHSNYIVVFLNGKFMLQSTISNSYLETDKNFDEVIGNIYENPELIKEAQ